MLSRIDKYFIALQHKKYHKPFKKFGDSKWGYVLTTLIALKVTVDEIVERWDTGAYVLAGIFIAIGILISIYAIRKLLLKKRIEKFEYRLKIVEAFIILYTGLDRFLHLWHAGYRNIRIYTLPLFVVLLFLFYLLMARMYYLKYNGTIKH